jgi:hypothetical protein
MITPKISYLGQPLNLLILLAARKLTKFRISGESPD